MTLFEKSARSWVEVFGYMSQLNAANPVLQRLFRSVRGQQIRLEKIPKEVCLRLRTALPPGEPLGALFVTDGTTGTIYLDFESELGILLPFLFHEIIHSLDESLWEIARVPASQSQRAEVIFKSECKAFQAQNRFLEELKVKYPELNRYYESRFSHIPFLQRAYRPDEIAEYCRQTRVVNRDSDF